MGPGNRAGRLDLAFWLAPSSLTIIFVTVVAVAAFAVFLPAAPGASAQPSFSDQLSVTTDKDIYARDDRIIVAGTLPMYSDGSGPVVSTGDGNAYTVRIQVSRDDRQCALQVVRADPDDRSFISKPIRVGNCGPGEYTVTAHYRGQTARTVFIMTADEADAGTGDLRLRMLKRAILLAQEGAGERVREVIDAGILLPEQAADAYRRGVIETSLALQAAQHGDTVTAKVHQFEAVAQFRQALAALAPERLSAISSQASAQSLQVMSSSAGGSDRLAMLQDLYQRLVSLARKNGLESPDLGLASSLLAEAREAMEKQGAAGGADAVASSADEKLDEAGAALERVRSQLVSHAGSAGAQKQKVLASADRLEREARDLLEKGEGERLSASLRGKIGEALSLINEARSDAAKGEFDHAKELLDDASRLLADAEEQAAHQQKRG